MTDPRKILIIQPRRIGDVIVTTPVIDALRGRFPQARIDFLVEPGMAPVLENYPGLNDRLIFDKKRFLRWALDIRRRRYDWVLDFMNNPRTAQLTLASGAPLRAGFRVPFWDFVYNRRVDRPSGPTYAVQSKFNLLRTLGIPLPDGVLPRIALAPRDFEGARAWWETHKLEDYAQRVAVMPAHRHAIRQWPPEKFRAAVKSLMKPGRAFLFFGGPGEEAFLAEMAGHFPADAFVIPPGPLRQAAALLSRCHAAITNDSGLMHTAVAVGVATVTVYGPTWPGSWNPQVPPHRFVQAQGLSCLGCNRDRCPYKHECMEWVSPARVAAEVEAALA